MSFSVINSWFARIKIKVHHCIWVTNDCFPSPCCFLTAVHLSEKKKKKPDHLFDILFYVLDLKGCIILIPHIFKT